MIVIRVELWSARTGKVTELARMGIANVGGTLDKRDYGVCTWRERSKAALDKAMSTNAVTRKGKVLGHPSEAVHIWYLVGKALEAMGYAPREK
jgi:hypothetical protein